VDQTFARCHRLTKTDEFSSVFGFRRAIRGQWLMLHYLPRSPGLPGARLGLVVGKKLLRRAVDRNGVKRRLREAFRRQRQEIPDCDLIVRLVARPGPADFGLLAGDFQRLLDKLPGRLARHGDSS
jgi:ribonuclease P protein component